MTTEEDVQDPRIAEAVAAFEGVRALPYAIDAAHDASGLIEKQAGNCLAKSALLAQTLTDLGFGVRMVRWLYLLPDVVPQTVELPDRLDLHRAVEVWRRGRWVLVDATHDPALASGGLTVGAWDGTSSTAPAYPSVGPRLLEGRDSAEIEDALARIGRWVDACPSPVLARWRRSYIQWLRDVRAGAVRAEA